jgi:peptidoglycan/LPS O-acetylase OafA/YrhL
MQVTEQGWQMIRGRVERNLAHGMAAIDQLKTQGSATYLHEVDALRALAVFLVIGVHTYIIPFGWMGVWIFFVISGFAITSSMEGSNRLAPGKQLLNFYVRRTLRIWPLYFCFLLTNLIVLIACRRWGPIESVPYIASFTYNLRMIFTRGVAELDWAPFSVLWTLSVEEQFYLIFPLIFIFTARRTAICALLGTMFISPAIRLMVGTAASHAGWSNSDANFAVYAFGPAHFDAFAAGALLALFRNRLASLPQWLIVALAAVIVSAAGLYFSFYVLLQAILAEKLTLDSFRNIYTGVTIGQGREVFLYTMIWLFAALALVLLISRQRYAIWLTNLPGLQVVGRVSCGIYMFHLAVILMFGYLIPALAGMSTAPMQTRIFVFCISSLVSIFLALISFRYLESPFLRFRKVFA